MATNRRDQFVADEANANWLGCTECGAGADRETLSSFGARCLKCYGAYCREHQPPGPPPSLAERARLFRRMHEPMPDKDPKAWAKALRDREQLGEFVSPVQAHAWRTALKQHLVAS